MMDDFSADFGPFQGRVWLNCAHQGPLPRVAAIAARRAIDDKICPHRIRDDAFDSVPQKLRNVLGKLIGKPGEEIILGNSATYGLHLVANGLRWRRGDEVVVVRGDFPADIFPWLALRDLGVGVRFVTPKGRYVVADDLRREFSSASRLFCVTWVNSYTGWPIDLREVGEVCRNHNVLFAINASQALGAFPCCLTDVPVDVVTCCGYKWLCGPFGTGFCWIRPDLIGNLNYRQAYWWPLREMRPETIESVQSASLGPRAYDIFCTGNFLNFVPWTAAVEYMLTRGLDAVGRHNDSLVARFLDQLDRGKYQVLSPTEKKQRTGVVVVTHLNGARNPEIRECLEREGIDIAVRRRNLRISPHLYNTLDDIDAATNALNSA